MPMPNSETGIALPGFAVQLFAMSTMLAVDAGNGESVWTAMHINSRCEWSTTLRGVPICSSGRDSVLGEFHVHGRPTQIVADTSTSLQQNSTLSGIRDEPQTALLNAPQAEPSSQLAIHNGGNAHESDRPIGTTAMNWIAMPNIGVESLKRNSPLGGNLRRNIGMRSGMFAKFKQRGHQSASSYWQPDIVHSNCH